MRLAASLVAVLSSTLAVGPTLAGDSWPTFRGPRGDGRAVSGLPAGDGALGMEVRWKKPLGSGYSGIVVEGDLLVTAGRADAEDVVIALAAADGSERWRASLGPAYAGHDGSHDGPIATPAIAGGRVFAMSPAGRLLALDGASGKVLWSREVAVELELPGPYYGSGGSPLVVGDLVVLWIGGEKGHVAAFDVASGALRWKQLEESTDAQSPVLATLAGKEQIVVIGGTHVAGLEPQDGKVLWQVEHKGGAFAMGAPSSSPLVLDGERIFFKHGADSSLVVKVTRTDSGFAAAVERDVRALARSYSPPALAGKLLFGYSGRFLSAVDPDTGTMLWRSREPGDGFLVAVEDQLVILSKDGNLHLGPASPTGWAESARLEVFDALAWTPPSVVGSNVYVRSLGAIARVELVRTTGATSVAAAPSSSAVPEVLAPLVTELATASDTAAAVTRFLTGKSLPIVTGDEVVFLWRGRGTDVAIAGDMIGMRQEKPMQRLGETDLWWWATKLDRRARVSYVFLVDNEPAADPSHTRRVAATVLGPDLNWQRAQGLQMSWLAMPNWPGNALAPNAARGRLERFEVAVPKPETTTGETIPVPLTAWLPPGYDQGSERLPVVYVHDRNALEHGRWPETLDRVVGRTVAPLLVVFAPAPRGVDLAAHFVTTLVPAVDARFRTLATRAGRANVGMGWSSHGALMLGLKHPQLFAATGLQSYYATAGEMMDEVVAALTAADLAVNPQRVYFEYGRWDLNSPHEGMNMQASGAWLEGKLRERGLQVIGGQVADSTDYASWRNRTDVLLESLFPAPGTTGGGITPWLMSTGASMAAP